MMSSREALEFIAEIIEEGFTVTLSYMDNRYVVEVENKDKDLWLKCSNPRIDLAVESTKEASKVWFK